jgi:DNA repair protein RecO (recombination protein O)
MSRAAALSAFVLHSYDWSETSLIVELFTRELGRVAVVAKGAKRPTSQLRAVLLPFQRIQASLGRSAARDNAASDIHTLRGAEWGGGLPQVRGEALFTGFYLNELLLKFLAREDPHPLLWNAYEATVAALGQASEAAALRAFELVLMQEVGYLPALDVMSGSLAPLPHDALLSLQPEGGLAHTKSDEQAGVDARSWLALHTALIEGDLSALQGACARVEPPLRRQLRHLLHYHLNTQQLKSRNVLRELQSFWNPPAAPRT